MVPPAFAPPSWTGQTGGDMNTSQSPSAHTQKQPHPVLAASLASHVPACRLQLHLLSGSLCLAGWLAKDTGLPEMTPGQATDGYPKHRPPRCLPSRLQAPQGGREQDPPPATSLTPPPRREGAFSHLGGNPKSASGAVVWRSSRGFSCGASGRNAEGGRETERA